MYPMAHEQLVIKDLFRAMHAIVGTEKCHVLQLANHMAACGSNSAGQQDDS
jgi:hypothetical protein